MGALLTAGLVSWAPAKPVEQGPLELGFTCNPERELKWRKCRQLDANLKPGATRRWSAISRMTWTSNLLFGSNRPMVVWWLGWVVCLTEPSSQEIPAAHRANQPGDAENEYLLDADPLQPRIV
jgi:hypothetical protein